MPDFDLLFQECEYQVSRSSGPGGQHANKASTQVTLRLDLSASEALTQRQKATLRERLAHRLTQEGILILSSQETRSQAANKEDAQRRLRQLVTKALTPPKSRIKTRPPRRAKEARLQAKKQRGEKKQWRKPPQLD